MQTRSSRQHRTHSESSENPLAMTIKPRPWGEAPQAVQRQSGPYSWRDMLPHDPSPRPAPNFLQAKLTVGAPNDVYEQEADRVAEQVMSTPDSAVQQTLQREAMPEEEKNLQMKPLAATITPLVQRESTLEREEQEALSPYQEREISVASPTVQCDGDEDFDADGVDQVEEETEEQQPSGYLEFLQMKPSFQQSSAETIASPSEDLESHLTRNEGNGSALTDETRSFMEARFGSDFSQVRIHTDSNSIQMNQELGAQAFTHKQDIYFGSGKYNPASDGGKRLLAHELTHVVQQTGGIHTKVTANQLTEHDKQVENRSKKQLEFETNPDTSQAVRRKLEKLVDEQYSEFLNTESPIARVSETGSNLIQPKCENCESEDRISPKQESGVTRETLEEHTQKLVALSDPTASVQLSPSCWAEKFNLVAAIAALVAAAGTGIAALLAPDPTTLTKWAAIGLIAAVIAAAAWVINGIIALTACLSSDPDANQREIEQLRRRQEQLERTIEQLRQLQQQPAPAPTP